MEKRRGEKGGFCFSSSFFVFSFSSSLMLSLSLSLPSLSTKSSHLLDLPAHTLRVGPRKVDLVQHRDDLQSGIQSQINVGERLGLDALASVDDEQRALAGRERARDLVAEVDVARSVDQVERVLDLLAVARSFAFAFFAVSLKPRRRPVAHPRRVELDGDPALALEVHAVEELRLHVAVGDGARLDQEDVGEGRFPENVFFVVVVERNQKGRRESEGAPKKR